MKRHPLVLAVSAGLAMTSPAIVQANCPAPVGGVVTVPTGTTVVVNSSDPIGDGCVIDVNMSIVVEAGGGIDLNYTGIGSAQGVSANSNALIGGISISGDVDVDSTGSARGIRLNGNTLTGNFNIAGTVDATGSDASAGIFFVNSELATPLTTSGTVRASGSLNNNSIGIFIEAYERGTNPDLTVTSSGRVESDGVAIYGVGLGQAQPAIADIWLNDGQIRAPEGSSIGGGIWLDARFGVGTLENNNLIEGRGVMSARPAHAIQLSEASYFQQLINTGTITAINGGDGIHIDGNYGPGSLNNDFGATISAVDQGSGIYSMGLIGVINNEGTISGAEHGISFVERGAGTQLINLGEISGGTGYDIYVDAGRPSDTRQPLFGLLNAQQGLTYHGVLPVAYLMLVTDSGRFGQMEVSNGASQMGFSVGSALEPSNSAASNGSFEEVSAPAVPPSNLNNNSLYPSVLSGVSEAMLLNTTGNSEGFDWELIPGSETNVWDLCVGDCSSSSVPVPVMGPWSLLALGGLSGLMGFWGIRRRQRHLTDRLLKQDSA